MIHDVVIIGTGCAGLTAAIYTARANLQPLVFTGRIPGGLLTTTTIVENFPGFPEGVDGFELMQRMQQQAERFGAQIKLEEIQTIDLSRRPFRLSAGGETWETNTVIIATGASHRHLGLDNERRLENAGVTYCATCDGALPMFRNKPLVVVGGGDSAMEEALYLTRFASRVFVIHRRNELRASPIMQERAKAHDKIEFVWNTVVTDVLGADQVEGVRLQDTVTGDTREMPCAGVFVAIGLVPNTALFKDQIALSPEGYVMLESGTRTSVPGVFAAGDVADPHYRQAITAAGTGCAAAMEAERFLAAT